MTEIRRILVPVDFSEGCLNALDHAAVWANRFDATVDLLHVLEAPWFTANAALADPALLDPKLFEQLQTQAEQAMQAFVEAARARGLAIRSTRCVSGGAALRIVEVAKEGGYKLIVMGTHGRTGLAHLLMGSVAERVVRLASCPVVTVRTKDLGR